MKEFRKVTSESEVLSNLKYFDDIFPHLHEKIDSYEAYAEKLFRLADVYVGEENGDVFGIAVFYANDIQTRRAYISLIGVKDHAQGKGLGYWLLTQCQQVCYDRGMKHISLEVDCDNHNAISFYQRNGFELSEKTQRCSMYMNKSLE